MVKPPKSMEPESVDLSKAGRGSGKAFQDDSFHNYMARKIDMQRQQFGLVLPPPPPDEEDEKEDEKQHKQELQLKSNEKITATKIGIPVAKRSTTERLNKDDNDRQNSPLQRRNKRVRYGPGTTIERSKTNNDDSETLQQKEQKRKLQRRHRHRHQSKKNNGPMDMTTILKRLQKRHGMGYDKKKKQCKYSKQQPLDESTSSSLPYGDRSKKLPQQKQSSSPAARNTINHQNFDHAVDTKYHTSTIHEELVSSAGTKTILTTKNKAKENEDASYHSQQDTNLLYSDPLDICTSTSQTCDFAMKETALACPNSASTTTTTTSCDTHNISNKAEEIEISNSKLKRQKKPRRRDDLFFLGIVVKVNGYTDPDNETLKRYLQRHGGDLETYETSRVTHIIAECLSKAKADIYRKQKNPRPVCLPSWIVDSMKVQKLLPYGKYILPELKSIYPIQQDDVGTPINQGRGMIPASWFVQPKPPPPQQQQQQYLQKEKSDSGQNNNSKMETDDNDNDVLVLKRKLKQSKHDVGFEYQIHQHSRKDHHPSGLDRKQQPSCLDNVRDGQQEQQQHGSEVVTNSESSESTIATTTSATVKYKETKQQIQSPSTTKIAGKTMMHSSTLSLNAQQRYQQHEQQLGTQSEEHQRTQIHREKQLMTNTSATSTTSPILKGFSPSSSSPFYSSILRKNDPRNTSTASREQQRVTFHKLLVDKDNGSKRRDNAEPSNWDSCRRQLLTSFVEKEQTIATNHSDNSDSIRTNNDDAKDNYSKIDCSNSTEIGMATAKLQHMSSKIQNVDTRKQDEHTHIELKSKDVDDRYINGRIRTVGTDPNFLESFFRSSRLSFIGSYKQRTTTSAGATTSTRTTTVPSKKTKRFVFHVDMDCFFAAVVLRNFPQYKDKPVAISHHGKSRTTDGASFLSSSSMNRNSTSECATCNYKAREFGIKKGMFLGRAKQLCPELVVLYYDFAGYEEVAEQVLDILERVATKYHGSVEPVSCDEAYVELYLPDDCNHNNNNQNDDENDSIDDNHYADAMYEQLKSNTLKSATAKKAFVPTTEQCAGELAETIRRDIFEATQCTASVGVASNKFLSKLATDRVKPNASFVCGTNKETGLENYQLLLEGLKLRDLPGIGYRTEPKLAGHGLVYVRDVWEMGKGPSLTSRSTSNVEGELCRILGPGLGKKIFMYCHGQDDRPVQPGERKTIGAECNYGVRFDGPYGIDYMMNGLAKEVEKRMEGVDVLGRRVTLKLKERKKGAKLPPKVRRVGKFLGHGSCHNHSKSRETPGAIATSDSKTIARIGMELFTELSISLDDVRGMGIIMSKLVETKQSDPSAVVDRRANGSISSWLAKCKSPQKKVADDSMTSKKEYPLASYNSVHQEQQNGAIFQTDSTFAENLDNEMIDESNGDCSPAELKTSITPMETDKDHQLHPGPSNAKEGHPDLDVEEDVIADLPGYFQREVRDDYLFDLQEASTNTVATASIQFNNDYRHHHKEEENQQEKSQMRPHGGEKSPSREDYLAPGDDIPSFAESPLVQEQRLEEDEPNEERDEDAVLTPIALPPLSQIHMSQVKALPEEIQQQIISRINISEQEQKEAQIFPYAQNETNREIVCIDEDDGNDTDVVTRSINLSQRNYEAQDQEQKERALDHDDTEAATTGVSLVDSHVTMRTTSAVSWANNNYDMMSDKTRFRQTNLKRMMRLAAVKSGSEETDISLTQLDHLPLEIKLQVVNEDSYPVGSLSQQQQKQKLPQPTPQSRDNTESHRREEPTAYLDSTNSLPRKKQSNVTVVQERIQENNNEVRIDNTGDVASVKNDHCSSSFDMYIKRDPRALYHEDIAPLKMFLDENPPPKINHTDSSTTAMSDVTEEEEAITMVQKFLHITIQEGRVRDLVILLRSIRNRDDGWGKKEVLDQLVKGLNTNYMNTYGTHLDMEWILFG